MAGNPWAEAAIDEARAYDRRKEEGPNRLAIAVKRELQWERIQARLADVGDRTVLDLGGGTGYWAIRIAVEGYRVHLTDLSPGYLARARENIAAAGLADRIAIEQRDICDLTGLTEGAYPLVLAMGDPLSYCTDASRALREMHRVCRPDGVLIGDVENRFCGAATPRRARSWADAKRILTTGQAHWPGEADPPIVVRQFTPQEIRQVLTDAGWQVDRLRPSDVLAELLPEEFYAEACATDAGRRELIDLERELQREPSLLGCGWEIEFVARKAPAQAPSAS